MNPTQHIWTLNWPMVLLAVVLCLIFYFIEKEFSRRSWFYAAGVMLLLLVTVSPLDPAGHHFLFSAHMIQHITLLLIVPPLLLNGLDGNKLRQITLPQWVKAVMGFLLLPVVAWMTGMGFMWFWHIPAIFLAMKYSYPLHSLHLFSMLVAGLIFIWPVHAPIAWKRLSSPLLSVLYLFMACVGCTILGIILTFSTNLYYVQAFIYDTPMAYSFIPESFRMTPSADQQVAGLIMWVPACIIYIVNSLVILSRWLRSTEPDYNK